MWTHTHSIDEVMELDFNRIDNVLYQEFMRNPYYIDLSQQLFEFYGNLRRTSVAMQIIIWRDYAAGN